MRLPVALLAVSVVLAGCGKQATPPPAARPVRLSLPQPVDEVRFDFESWDPAKWSPSPEKWAAREVADAPSGSHVLARTVLDAASPSLVWDGDEFADVELEVRFRFLGRAQGTALGLVLRQSEIGYYVLRVTPEGDWHASIVERGALTDWVGGTGAPFRSSGGGDWHVLSNTAIGDQQQVGIDGNVVWLDRDDRLKKGKVGLWWVGGSAVQYDDLVIRTPAARLSEFAGLDWSGVAGPARVRFFERANQEKCPCGSGRTLARCRRGGCEKALDRGTSLLEECESQ